MYKLDGYRTRGLLILLLIFRLEGLDDRVMQWCVCRLEAWFAADADEISLKNWDQVSTHHLTTLSIYL
jgi:hypothetical protein